MSRRSKWLIVIALSLSIAAIAIYVAGRRAAARIEPYIREQAIQYLQDRFDADAEIGALNIHLPPIGAWKLFFTKGRGALAGVSAHNILLHRKNRPGEPPLFRMRSFSFAVDLAKVMEYRKKAGGKEVQAVLIEGLEIHVPPKNDRPKLSGGSGSSQAANVLIEDVWVNDARLVIHPRDPSKRPLDFAIQKLHLKSAGMSQSMQYEASLRNPKPPGQIESTGHFGPWDRDDPGSSPLEGKYTFSDADLGVFPAIAGILQSNGEFKGELSRIIAKGEAYVPDFRLTMSGNRVPLRTKFEVEVDGTNGNTILKPVHAQLGSSRFVTSGSVIKNHGDPKRTIILDVKMNGQHLEDFLRLAMKGPTPFLTGIFDLNARIHLPPLERKVAEKLKLQGKFEVKEGHFATSTIQDKIDDFSRKGQGQPKNEEIDNVVANMSGEFTLEDRVISFSRLGFVIPGAIVNLAGSYDLGGDDLDFHGALKLQAKMSQTQTGIKRWILKPVDPFFSKNGAGTFLRIQISGKRESPSFGLDHGKPDKVPEGPETKAPRGAGGPPAHF